VFVESPVCFNEQFVMAGTIAMAEIAVATTGTVTQVAPATVKVFQHLFEIEFVLRYPCCKTFIACGLCIDCIPASEVANNGGGGGGVGGSQSGGGELLPYLLFLGRWANRRCLFEMPVFHVDVVTAKHILDTMWWQRQMCTFELCDIKGECHSIRLNGDCVIARLCSTLSYYVNSNQTSANVQLSPFTKARHFLWEIENRAMEMICLGSALTERRKSGKKWQVNEQRLDKQAADLIHPQYSIIGLAMVINNIIHDEDQKRLLGVHCALN